MLAMLILSLGVSTSSPADAKEIVSCDQLDDIESTGVAECEGLRKNGEKGRVTVKRVTQPTSTPSKKGNSRTGKAVKMERAEVVRYEVTAEVDCDICEGGVKSATTTVKNVNNLHEVVAALFNNQTREMAEQRDQAACLKDENGNSIEYDLKKSLQCHLNRLVGMNGEEADSYYDENLHEGIQKLLMSGVPSDRAFAMKLLAQLGEKKNIDCASQVKANNNPISMTSMRPGSLPSAAGESLKRSCELWAFGTYNQNVENLQMASLNPENRSWALPALNSLQSTWGRYFAQKGMVGSFSSLTPIQTNDISADVAKINAEMDRSLKQIMAPHKDILESGKKRADIHVSYRRNVRIQKPLKPQPAPEDYKPLTVGP